MKKIVLLVLAAFAFSNCEKDDICDATTSTTSRLVIEFYDISNPTTLKNVTKLRVKADGVTQSLTFNETLPESNPDRYLYTGNKISIPLKTSSQTNETTNYSFFINSDVVGLQNEDRLTINYTQNNVFVSRACGYKTIFTLNSSPNGIIGSDSTPPDTFWIQGINIVTSNIENENEIHVKLFF
jgi:hypothetical protein